MKNKELDRQHRERVRATQRRTMLTRLQAKRQELEFLLGHFPDDPELLSDLERVKEMEARTIG